MGGAILSQELFKFNGALASSKIFNHIPSSFAEAYRLALHRFGERNFLKVYPSAGDCISKTLIEFNLDVERVKSILSPLRADFEVLVTIAGNTYEHLIFITAGLLSNYIISPINPQEGRERILSKIEQIGMTCVVATDLSLFDKPKDFQHHFVSLELPEFSEFKFHADVVREPLAPFAFIFTSGSTGYSKIVMQSEMGVMSNVEALIERHNLATQKVIATSLPIFHVNALEFSFLCSLLSGQSLILFEQFNFVRILHSLENDRVHIFSGIPQMLKTFLDLAPKINAIPQLKLEYFVSAAASLSPELAKSLCKTFKFKIIQGYGLSEAVNFSLTLPTHLTKERTDFWLTNFSRPSVGTALKGNQISILSLDGGHELAEGETGEVCIRGFSVMLGYKDQSTDQVFANDFLHTGDRGFFHECDQTKERYYFISSRMKDVIKRFGQTVSLAEIDDLILKWSPPGLLAIAVPFENHFSGEEIGVVFSSKATADEVSSLQNFLLNEVPAFMRPRVLIPSDLSLTTASGKPKRWAFVQLFDAYKKQFLVEAPVLQNSQS